MKKIYNTILSVSRFWIKLARWLFFIHFCTECQFWRQLGQLQKFTWAWNLKPLFCQVKRAQICETHCTSTHSVLWCSSLVRIRLIRSKYSWPLLFADILSANLAFLKFTKWSKSQYPVKKWFLHLQIHYVILNVDCLLIMFYYCGILTVMFVEKLWICKNSN